MQKLQFATKDRVHAHAWGGTTYAKSPPNLMVEMVPILMGKDVVSFQ